MAVCATKLQVFSCVLSQHQCECVCVKGWLLRRRLITMTHCLTLGEVYGALVEYLSNIVAAFLRQIHGTRGQSLHINVQCTLSNPEVLSLPSAYLSHL